LPEALARSHNDSVLSRPARAPQRGEKPSLARAIWRRMLSRPARTIAGATLAAVLVGIVVNALLLQKSHRVAPFHAEPSPVASAAPAPIAPTPAAPASSEAAASIVALPPARPADLGGETTGSVTPKGGDPIRDLLRGDAGKEPDAKRLTMAAQAALIKLGYAVKADGVAGASTMQAIQQFEHSRGLGPPSEITAKLVKQLTAAANSAAH